MKEKLKKLTNIFKNRYFYYIIAFLLMLLLSIFDLKEKLNDQGITSNKYLIGIAIIGIVIFIIFLIIIKFIKHKKLSHHIVFAIIALTFGSMYLVGSPLFTGSDEHNHYYRIYEITTGNFITPVQENDIVGDQFSKYLNRYEMMSDVSETKPTESEFLNKLSHHALLDRVSSQSNQIGFLNDFIFGLMIAGALEHEYIVPSDVKGKYLDITITALATASSERRNKLYSILSSTIAKETPQRKLNASIILLKSIQGSYESEYFDGIYFGEKISIINSDTFKNSIFTNCVFNNCEINTDAFKTCQFYNCSFYNVKIVIGETLDCELIFLSCTGHQRFAEAAYRENKKVEHIVDYERTVLEQYWKPGYDMAEPRRAYQTLLRGVAQSDKMAVAEAIDSLTKKGILIKKARVIELNFEKMEEIKKIIHR